MTRSKTAPDAAPSAAHTAPDPARTPAAAPAPDSPAAAVCAALAANPGSTVAVIAGAAATGKPAARDALLAMEKAGTATRARGGKPGIPDTWTLADPVPDQAGPTADPEHEQRIRAAGDPDGSSGRQDRDGDAGADASAAPDPGTEQAGPHDDAPARGDREDAALDDAGDEAAPGGPQGADTGDDPPEADAPAGSGGEAGDAPDPALVTDLTERTSQIKAAADAAAAVLAGGGDLRAALAGLDEAFEQAAQARRSLRAAISGRKAPAVRPGGLRDKVQAHLDDYPDKEFTPHEIHKVLSHSSGAIANALETLVKLGEAEVAAEKPRRFRRAAKPAARSADSAQGKGTELAGAA